jgi:chromosome segregation ATPase
MSSELMAVLAVASVAALVGGGLVAWFTASRRPAADPAEDGRRQLELLELTESAERSRRESQAAGLALREQRALLDNAHAHLQSLEEQVAAYLRQYAQAKNALKAEIRQKNSLRMELAAATAQVMALEGRIQELEMERAAGMTGTRQLLAS